MGDDEIKDMISDSDEIADSKPTSKPKKSTKRNVNKSVPEFELSIDTKQLYYINESLFSIDDTWVLSRGGVFYLEDYISDEKIQILLDLGKVRMIDDMPLARLATTLGNYAIILENAGYKMVGQFLSENPNTIIERMNIDPAWYERIRASVIAEFQLRL